jgi:hypothetical protein
MVLVEQSINDRPKHTAEKRVTELRKGMHVMIPCEDNGDRFLGHKHIVHLRFLAQGRTVIRHHHFEILSWLQEAFGKELNFGHVLGSCVMTCPCLWCAHGLVIMGQRIGKEIRLPALFTRLCPSAAFGYLQKWRQLWRAIDFQTLSTLRIMQWLSWRVYQKRGCSIVVCGGNVHLRLVLLHKEIWRVTGTVSLWVIKCSFVSGTPGT